MKKVQIISFFIFCLFLSKIHCEEDCSSCQISNKECTCQQKDCKWFKINASDPICMICSEISNGESPYYSRKYNLENQPYCQKVGKSGLSGSKLILGTNQVASNCKELGLYNLGDICYDDCPENSQKDTNEYTCQCEDKFYREIKEGFTYITCVEKDKPCPSQYNYIDSKECLKACPKGKPNLEKDNNNNYLCKGQCPSRMHLVKSPLGQNIIYCYDICPDVAKFYYDDDNICIEKCSRSVEDYYDSNNKCIEHNNKKSTDCGFSGSYFINISPDDYIFQCINEDSTNKPCPTEFPYKFNKDEKIFCLKSCENTNIEFFGNIISYLYTEGGHSECIDIENTELFMIEREKRLVSDCSLDSYWPFHIGKKCVSNCGDKYIDNETNECVDTCNDYKDEQTKICFKECPHYLGRGFFNENKVCVACGMNGDDKGFHKDKNYNDNKCYSQCPDSFKHNNNNNICFEGECKNHDNKFSSKEHPEICYYNCNEIGEDFTIEKDYICYKEDQIDDTFNNYYYYETNYGIKKYVNKDGCVKNGLFYLKGQNCIKKCQTNEYKVYPTDDKLGKCFENIDDCINNECKFYDSSKVCSKTCDYYTIGDSTGSIKIENENCFTECPSNYPFLDGKICKQECDECYIEEFGIKKCVSKGDYFIQKIDGKNKCVKYCIKEKNARGIPTFGYYDSNKNCLDTCLGNNNYEYSYEATNKHQPCLIECPGNEYYYEDKKICLKKCDIFIQNKHSHICVEKCGNGQYILPGNICSDECNKEAPFFYKLENENDSNIIYKCVIGCKFIDGYNYFTEEKECLKDKPTNMAEKGYSIYNGGLIKNCPTSFINEERECVYNGESNNFKIGIEGIINVDSCGEWYVLPSKECIEKCPLGNNFIGSNRQCLPKCDELEFYHVLDSSGDYIIYECVGQCTNPQVYIYGEKECLSNCGDLYEKENICYPNCIEQYGLYNQENHKNICVTQCDDKIHYEGENKMCVDECSFSSSKIILINEDNKKECVSECNSNNFLEIKNGELYCSTSCTNEDTKKYYESNHICMENCDKYIQDTEDSDICLDQCDSPNKITIIGNKKICSSSCLEGYQYSYDNSQMCLSSCYPGDYIIDGTNTCINECNNNYYEGSTLKENKCVENCQSTGKNFKRINNHCDTECDSNPSGDYFYLLGNYDCIGQSSCEGKKMDGRICRESCSDNNQYYEENKCLSDCYYAQKIYHLKDQFLCGDDNNNYILEKNSLQSQCNENDNFYNDGRCVEECPKGRNYYISSKICQNDCENNNQYYKEVTELSKKMLKCENNCKSYVNILGDNKLGKLCLGEQCNSVYPYYTLLGNDLKECFEKCPSEYNYYLKIDKNSVELKCINKDTENIEDYIIFQNTNIYIKKTDCYPNYIDMDSNKCVEKCSEGQAIYITNLDEDNPIKYCSSNCNGFNEELHLDLNEQVCTKDNCPENEEIITKDNGVKKCDCKNLYYNDISSGIKICLDENEINCTKLIDYPYLIKGTKQCSDKCEGILSLNGSDCYTNDNYECPDNSAIKTNNNMRQCVCNDKYYHFDTDNSKEIYCLPEGSKCPRNETFNRELYISDTKECVEYCPFKKYTKKYGKTCVDLCPIMSVVVNDECFCQDKWYMNEKDEMICTIECPKEKPILIDQTKECVKTCIDTKFPVYYKKKCYSNCEKFPQTERIDNIKDIENLESHDYKGYKLNDIYGEYGESICYCKGAWYEDITNNKDGCNEDILCKSFDEIYSYKYTVLPTKECVSDCNKYFPYKFNDNCFESCEKGNEILGYTGNVNKILIEGDSYTCKCNNLWKYDTNDISKIECLEEENCEEDFLLIVNTNECYNSSQCRQDNPLLFNKKCYNQNNCPTNTIYKEDSPMTCSCIKYYYIDSNNNIVCLSEEQKCTEDYPNLIYAKDKCVENNDEELNNLFNYNGIYYNFCPITTKPSTDSNSNICICDPLYGYWYKEGDLFTCGLRICPDHLSKYFVNTRECLSKCSSNQNNYVEYNGICYESCPELTKKNDQGVCELQPAYEPENITQFTQVINNNIANLYKVSKKEKKNEEEEEESHIIELVNSNLTIEFYGVNKNKKENKNNHNKKNKASSSLSYIDLSECLEKIYEDNNMDPDDDEDDIIILKYDLTNTPKEYLINPIEYKFISSKTGKELDASGCGHKAIKISYPFMNIISNYDKISKKRRILEAAMIDIKSENDLSTLSEKYNIGKEINGEYSSIDSFNSKDSIYTDFCTAVVINGKDLILEDRMNYLLPHYSLCERNCTYNHTDFEEERIYCDCPFKNEFDLNREHDSAIELNENAVIQSQDGKSNLPVLKCISVLGDSKRIKSNIGFFYMLIVFIIEICLVFLNIILGYKVFKLFFGNKVIDNNNITENEIEIEINNKKENNKNNYEDIMKTTQRSLNNPPIRTNNEDNEDEKNEIEFIPDEFIFLYFNDEDKGVKKSVEKNMLPFNINKNTKVLLQKIENYDYTNVKADGPFHEDQNLIEVIDNSEDKVKFNIESINDTILDNENINEKNNGKNKTNEKEIIAINEEKIYKRENLKNYIINDLDEIEEDKEDNKINNGLLNEMKLEQRLLTKDYDFVSKKYENKLITILLTEILDKIYITKNILFLRKYDMMYLSLSVYVLYHTILLTILALFYDIKTIKNIWNKENYPGMGLYLGYGILTAIITWLIYIIINCLLTNKGKYNEIINIKNSKKRQKDNKTQLINKKVNLLISKMKTKMIIYYIIQFVLLIFFFIYLVTLCAVYSGTMNKIFASYGIAILEILIIKILYGLILGIMRYYSISNDKNGLYNFILFFEKYLV